MEPWVLTFPSVCTSYSFGEELKQVDTEYMMLSTSRIKHFSKLKVTYKGKYSVRGELDFNHNDACALFKLLITILGISL